MAGFSPGDVNDVPCSLNELLINFPKKSSGLGRFCRLEFQRMANWPSFDKKIETGIIVQNRRPVRAIDYSQKLTNSSLREKGTFINVPGKKSCQRVENHISDSDPTIVGFREFAQNKIYIVKFRR